MCTSDVTTCRQLQALPSRSLVQSQRFLSCVRKLLKQYQHINTVHWHGLLKRTLIKHWLYRSCFHCVHLMICIKRVYRFKMDTVCWYVSTKRLQWWHALHMSFWNENVNMCRVAFTYTDFGRFECPRFHRDPSTNTTFACVYIQLIFYIRI